LLVMRRLERSLYAEGRGKISIATKVPNTPPYSCMNWTPWQIHPQARVICLGLTLLHLSVGIPCTSAMHLVHTTHLHHCLSTGAHQVYS
jgi:hypothetical protein